jgi:hypothetical protein
MPRDHIESVQPDAYIFLEIAAQHDRGGATVAVIRDGVDHRQKIYLTDAELDEGIRKLETSGHIRAHGDRYFVAESLVPSLPRTASGQLSFRHQDWDKLRQRLLET